MSVLLLATFGGLLSALSTGLGALLTPYVIRLEKIKRWHLGLDFALGVMLSAVAFSLVGPELLKGEHVNSVFLGLLVGSAFIYLTHSFIEKFETNLDSGKLLLVGALIFHNLPEGMGAGASLAGMQLADAIPLQLALSIQNIAEGLLLSLLLRSFGLSLRASILGGIGSGFIELTGAIGAGVLMREVQGVLPFLLSLAGGSMLTSVLLEIHESYLKGKSINLAKLAGGLLVVPVTNLIFGF